MNQETKLIYGLRNGELVRVTEVVSGLECNCICPECKAPLIARKGSVRQHHFAHSSDTNCGGGVESSLHWLAKKVLSERQVIVLPKQDFVTENRREKGHFPQHPFRIHAAKVETKIGEVVPDILISISGAPVAVEILVTHKVDEIKVGKYRAMGLPAIEIDLSGIDRELPEEEIARLVIEGGAHKYWVNFHLQNIARALFPEPLKIVRDQSVGLVVAGCPRPFREFGGAKYSSPADCKKCPFFLKNTPSKNDEVRCSGR